MKWSALSFCHSAGYKETERGVKENGNIRETKRTTFELLLALPSHVVRWQGGDTQLVRAFVWPFYLRIMGWLEEHLEDSNSM